MDARASVRQILPSYGGGGKAFQNFPESLATVGLQILRGRAPFQASESYQTTVAAPEFAGIYGTIRLQEFLQILPPRVLSLHWTSVKPCQNP